MPDARLQPVASKEWSALRLWAASVRDNDSHHPDTRHDAKTLTTILDAHQDMKGRHDYLAEKLWQSALLLANKITKKGVQS